MHFLALPLLCLAADADYRTTGIIVTFTPSDEGITQRLCGSVPIINNDMIGNEPDEEFSVTLVSTMPPGGSFGDTESCITIIDDDGESVDVYLGMHTYNISVANAPLS